MTKTYTLDDAERLAGHYYNGNTEALQQFKSVMMCLPTDTAVPSERRYPLTRDLMAELTGSRLLSAA